MAVKSGGSGDVSQNPALAQVVAQAKTANMPKANIERAIAKALTQGSGGGQQVVLEGYGPNGIAVMVQIETDNRQRTTAEIKSIFSRVGGSLGAPGSAEYMFKSGVKVPVPQEDIGSFKDFIKTLENHEDVSGVRHVAEL